MLSKLISPLLTFLKVAPRVLKMTYVSKIFLLDSADRE